MVFFLSFFKTFYFILEYIPLTGGSAGKKKNPPAMWEPGCGPRVGKIPWRRE